MVPVEMKFAPEAPTAFKGLFVRLSSKAQRVRLARH